MLIENFKSHQSENEVPKETVEPVTTVIEILEAA